MDISLEALYTVREALENFRNDIEGKSDTASNRRQNCLDECEKRITAAEMKTENLEEEISVISEKIQRLEQKIMEEQQQIQQITVSLPQQESQRKDLEDESDYLRDRLAALQAQLANADDDSRQQIQAQIDRTQRELVSVGNSIKAAELHIREDREKKERLQREKEYDISEKTEYENRLTAEKKRWNQYRKKRDDLKIMGNHLRSDFDSYVEAMKKFEAETSEDAGDKAKTVEECISIIEELTSVI